MCLEVWETLGKKQFTPITFISMLLLTYLIFIGIIIF